MQCMSCKNEEMKKDKSAYFADFGTCYVIIENVPCYKCEKCGEVFYLISVAKKIEKILEQIVNVTSKIFIFDYSKAA